MNGTISIGGLSFRIAASLICITCIFYMAVMRGMNRKRLRSRLFVALMGILLVDCITGFISTYMMNSNWPYLARFIIAYLCKFVYYTTHIALIPVFCMYIIVVCDVLHKFGRVKLVLFFAPFWLLEIAVFTNPLTHFIFLYDKDLVFYRGVGIYVAYIISFIYVLFCVILLGRFWRSMNSIQKFAMFYFLVLSTIGALVQMVFPNIVCELLAEALGLMGVMILIERDEYRLDYKTHANNRTALVHDLGTYFAVKRDFYVICIRVINDELYRRVVGYEGYDALMTEIADFLMNIDYNYDAYRSGGGNFFLLCPDIVPERADFILELIQERFSKSFEAGGGLTNVMVKILCAKCPEELSDPGDILLLAETEITDSSKTIFKGKDLGFLLRKIDIEKVIVRGMAEENFLVKYQPVYDKYSHTIHSAEAILTLTDKEFGKIDFNEFMTVAEETGFIPELEHRMIDSVCRFIRDGVAHSGLGISTLVIHIMSVQVMTEELVAFVKNCIEKYVIDPTLLVFDISDTIAMQAQEVMSFILDEFKDMGIRFVLVNNEAGILGLGNDMLDKFDGVAINLSRLYSTDDEEQADIILKTRTTMIHQLGKMMILSGINTRELYNKANKVQADLIVGDYLCGLVTRNELQNKFWHMDTLDLDDDRE